MMSALNDKLLVVTNQGTRASFMSVSPAQGSNQAVVRESFRLDEHAG